MARSPEPTTQTAPACHGALQAELDGLPLVTIVGQPNVGKSSLFNQLTGAYVGVSNYPGTTVEISQGRCRMPNGYGEVGIVDTPGMFSLFPITEEERVARRILLSERPQAVIHVIDAKNLERMLPLTLQLIEAELPVVLVLNMIDEADQLGIAIDTVALLERLQVPVLATACTTGRGLPELRQTLSQYTYGHGSL